MTESVLDRYPWWGVLKHGGLLIAPGKLPAYFPETLPELDRYLSDRLRRAVVRVQDGDETAIDLLLDTVLEEVLGLRPSEWTKGPRVSTDWTRRAVTGEALKPRRIWQSPDGGFLPIFSGKRDGSRRLGAGRGRREVSQVIEWLRKTGNKVAVLTNGRQWRLIHAGTDYDAFCEWDVDLWFEQGQPSLQVDALRALLGREGLEPKDGRSPLLTAILDSKKGQAEISSALGERVRRAVELVIQASTESIDVLKARDAGVQERDLYIAAVRMVMRCVVILFAEARELLPRDNPIYESSYGLQSLREQLDRLAGGRGSERLRYMHGAWPRLISLFRLVYHGSGHEALPIYPYGGKLFAPGDPESPDPVVRALMAFESAENHPPDVVVHRMLELLTRSKVKVRQGRGSTQITAPVDFSDLSSEYIGILYEGLLDFELRQAPAHEPIVFLAVGDQPALPFSRLEAVTEEAMKELLEKLGKPTKGGSDEEEGQDGDDDLVAEEELDEEVEAGDAEVDADDEPNEDVGDDDARRIISEMVEVWAAKAVKAANIVKYPRNDRDPRVREQFAADVAAAATRLVARIVMPNEYFLVRWGGTRKGSGTFYTRPQLAGPTVWRTLQPLAYESVGTLVDSNTGLETTIEWRPRTPEEILSLKICDPAMGSGSFLISALRFLSDALLESLYHHGRFTSGPDRTICKLADGLPLNHPSQETLPVPLDHPDFEERLRGRLRRHLVERCLYGVDLDPLAVELGQMALWVETMDSRLPFGFLDHKMKVGNSLVGCWLDRYQDYPVLAWEREGGDANHVRFVHHSHVTEVTRGKKKGQIIEKGDVWTTAIKQKREEVKSELADVIRGQLRLGSTVPEAEGVFRWARTVFEELHSLPIHATAERSEAYAALQEDANFQRLREAFDLWCAIWFWPGDRLDDVPMPGHLLSPADATRQIVAELASEHRFLHWELEFPDVFGPDRAGFDALIGNPPWETIQPDSKEFFSNIDPLYRTYGKQDGLAVQMTLFRDSHGVESDWIKYNAHHKALANWATHAGAPYGDDESVSNFSFSRSGTQNSQLHAAWTRRRIDRTGYASLPHPFRVQGSGKPYTYKLFLELGYALCRERGRFGFIVPSGVYTDKGTTDLRTLFLNECRWEWLFGFENREKVFDIHSSFKFCPVILEKGGPTLAINTAFMQRRLEDWEEAEQHALAYPASRVEQFSPKSKSILEIRSDRDLMVLEKLYANGVLLGDDGPDGWGLQYRQGDFNMTSDSKLFPPLPKWEAKGYKPDEYGHWLKGDWRPVEAFGFDRSRHRLDPQYNHWSILDRPDGLVLSRDGAEALFLDGVEDVALPLYEGRMIGQFDFSEKGWVSGKGRSAEWRMIPLDAKQLEPQYLMGLEDVMHERSDALGAKLAFMPISSATNSRSMVASAFSTMPAGHSISLVRCHNSAQTYRLSAILNSFAYDYQMRARLGGLNISEFLLAETALPSLPAPALATVAQGVLSLTLPQVGWAGEWIDAQVQTERSWRSMWALSEAYRLEHRVRCEVIALVSYGLSVDDLSEILKDCDHPASTSAETKRSFDPKGFWRIDSERHPELRLPVLTQVAMRDLEQMGFGAFLGDGHNEGWKLPDFVRLGDYGLGKDGRAKDKQPVAGVLGLRLYDWQTVQDVAESWVECRLHAQLIRRIVPLPDESIEPATSPRSSSHTPFGRQASLGL